MSIEALWSVSGAEEEVKAILILLFLMGVGTGVKGLQPLVPKQK